MKTKFKAILTLIALLALQFEMLSQENFFKKYEKSYTVTKSTQFVINNKYGKVHIENTTADKVEILVNISTESKSKEKADELLKKIEINFNQSGDIITAVTNIESGTNFKSLQIDYFVKMPEYIKLDLTNKYGDIFINRLTSNSVINCSYGNLKINELMTSELSNLATVNIKYSNGDISKCDYLNLDVKYSKMEVGESRAVFINSAYSKVEFENAYIIKAVSKYDPTYEVENVSKMELAGKYSDYDIGTVKNTFKTEVSYSNVEIENVLSGFENLEIISKYGNVEVDIDEAANYSITGSAEYGSITSKVKSTESESGLLTEVKGFTGSDPNPKSNIFFSIRYGNIEIE